jgi:coenzyme F420-reducing hydrogenase delta subunit
LPGDVGRSSVRIIEFKRNRVAIMKNTPYKIVFFYCSNSLDTDALRQSSRKMGNDEIKTVSLPCSGKVNLLYLLKAFENGADGVILITCNRGECRFLEGNLRAHKRAEAVDAMLEEIGLGRGRMRVVQGKKDGGLEPVMAALNTLKENLSTSPRRSSG